MKVVAAVIGTLTLISLFANMDMVGKPREPITITGGVVTIIYGGFIILLCMRVLGWV
jgi:hypothetical protein